MSLVGLYAGIGGFELGFQAAGFETVLLADKDESCRIVLGTRFPSCLVVGNVSAINLLPPSTEIVTAGFPCQNLSMAGDKAGIKGRKTGDVSALFELLSRCDVGTLVLENVYFLLSVDRGQAMSRLIEMIEGQGYSWAYRVVDLRAFGLPQRRRRVVFVASKVGDATNVLFADEAPTLTKLPATLDRPLGFYWTEGRSGVGLVVDGVPPVKAGSTLSIPSPPAVLFPDGRVLTPSIEACERLQGFAAGWTDMLFTVARSPRWTMVGNAMPVPIARWIAERVRTPGRALRACETELVTADRWPSAARGASGRRFRINASEFPHDATDRSILDFLDDGWRPLSARALSGFIGRAETGSLRFPAGFLDRLRGALAMRREEAA